MTGLLGKKRGMTSVFDEAGRRIPATLLEVGPCPVVQVKFEERDSYSALQLAFDPVSDKKVSAPRMGHMKRAGVSSHRLLREFRDFRGEHKPGDVIRADLFSAGEKVHVIGWSKGRGFTGGIKRHGFHRPVQSHGTHEAFRGSGSQGAGSYPARVWPGKKSAGRMGGTRFTIKNLKVIKVDVEKGLILVKGAVPGANGGYVRVVKTGL